MLSINAYICILYSGYLRRKKRSIIGNWAWSSTNGIYVYMMESLLKNVRAGV